MATTFGEALVDPLDNPQQNPSTSPGYRDSCGSLRGHESPVRQQLPFQSLQPGQESFTENFAAVSTADHHDLKLLQRPSSSLEIPVEDEQSVCPRTQGYPSMHYFATLLSLSDDEWLYFLDSGKEDLDIAARSGPVTILGAEDMRRSSDDSSEYTYGKARPTDFNDILFRYSCYEKLVSRQMPRHLLSLPDVSISNPTNLLYFHHFIDNTASLLVGHDCSCNPFKSIVPRSKTQSSKFCHRSSCALDLLT